jgi:hypothetical protein
MYPETRVCIHVLYTYFNISITKLRYTFCITSCDLFALIWIHISDLQWLSYLCIVLNYLMMVPMCPKHVAYENTFLLCRRFFDNYLYTFPRKWKHTQHQNCWTRCFLCSPCRIKYSTQSKESRWLVLHVLSSKRRSHSQTHKWSWNEQKFGHGSRWGPKPRTTMPAKTSRNLRLSYAMRLVLPRTTCYITNFNCGWFSLWFLTNRPTLHTILLIRISFIIFITHFESR